MNRIKVNLLAIAFVTSWCVPSYAGIAIIAHPDNDNSISSNQLRKIYLGKTKTFPNGDEVIPLDLPSGDSTRDEFLKTVVKKDESAMNSYWARMLFSSKGKPPKVLDDATSVKKYCCQKP